MSVFVLLSLLLIVSVILQSWTPKEAPKFVVMPEMNLFNDNINFTIFSFDYLRALNNRLMEVAKKFTWLAATKATPVLEGFKTNLEVVQTLLGDLEERLIDFPSDGVDELVARGKELEALLLEYERSVEAWNARHPVPAELQRGPKGKRVTTRTALL